jgi:hypothetical protein
VFNNATHTAVVVGDGLIAMMGAIQKAVDLLRGKPKPSGYRWLGLSLEGCFRPKCTLFSEFTKLALGCGKEVLGNVMEDGVQIAPHLDRVSAFGSCVPLLSGKKFPTPSDDFIHIKWDR